MRPIEWTRTQVHRHGSQKAKSDRSSTRESWADLGRRVLESYRAEYAELSDVWRTLDTKAQGATAIAGIFLAAAFSFAKDAAGRITPLQSGLLALAIGSLLASITLAILALRVRVVSLPPIGEQLEELVNDVLGADEVELPDRLPALVRDESKLWKAACRDVAAHNGSKAALLRGSVIALLASAVIVAEVTVWFILCGHSK